MDVFFFFVYKLAVCKPDICKTEMHTYDQRGAGGLGKRREPQCPGIVQNNCAHCENTLSCCSLFYFDDFILECLVLLPVFVLFLPLRLISLCLVNLILPTSGFLLFLQLLMLPSIPYSLFWTFFSLLPSQISLSRSYF